MLDRTEQVIADAVREVFDGHCGTGARVDPEPPSWEQVGREVVAGLAAEGGVVAWRDDEHAAYLLAEAIALYRASAPGQWSTAVLSLNLDEARRALDALSPVSAETTESER